MALFVCHALIKPVARLNFTSFGSCSNSSCNDGPDPQVRCALRSSVTSHLRTTCGASESERVAELSKTQMKSTELLAELLKTENPHQFAQEHVDSLTEDFFSRVIHVHGDGQEGWKHGYGKADRVCAKSGNG